MRTLIVTLALLIAGPAAAAGPADPFWAFWSDGKAELNGYTLLQPRYGQQRKGRAVLVFVTEPYSKSRQVKVDRYDRKNPDHTTVLKLNHVRKFQTGIYDYSVMTSVFSEPTEGFRPRKVTFSGQEWCGHVFENIAFNNGAEQVVNSYFEGESTNERFSIPGLGSEDALFIQIRGLRSDPLKRETISGEMLDSALHRRLTHVPAQPHKITVEWAKESKKTKVPAGEFQTVGASWSRKDGTRCTAEVEVPYPHKIIEWRCTDGEVAQLTGSTRQPYWAQHKEGDEQLLKKLGMPVP